MLLISLNNGVFSSFENTYSWWMYDTFVEKLNRINFKEGRDRVYLTESKHSELSAQS